MKSENLNYSIYYKIYNGYIYDGYFLNGSNYDLIDLRQVVLVEPGQTYIFGGWVKLENFTEGIRFEVGTLKGAARYFWKTDVAYGEKSWKLLFNSFVVPADCKKIIFFAARVENLIHGKAYIDNVFLYKTKQPLLAYD